jgi:hypothetical protein
MRSSTVKSEGLLFVLNAKYEEKETNVNSPFRMISYGPLLFALPVKDVYPNTQNTTAKWNYAKPFFA